MFKKNYLPEPEESPLIDIIGNANHNHNQDKVEVL